MNSSNIISTDKTIKLITESPFIKIEKGRISQYFHDQKLPVVGSIVDIVCVSVDPYEFQLKVRNVEPQGDSQ